MISSRELAAYVVLASFLAVFLSCGMSEGPFKAWSSPRFDYFTSQENHNFSCFKSLRMLTRSEFPLDVTDRRVIVVGDIHGMIYPLNKLLATVDYDPESDVLIHTGDIVAKSSLRDSLAVLSFMAKNNITGVRGNHDQMVIEWKGWIDWICSSHQGCEWLRRIEHDWDKRHRHDKSLSVEDFLDSEKKSFSYQDKRWWSHIPSDWKLLEDHYRIARAMTDEHYQYLTQLPLRLYVPTAHTYIVHAGLLPSDPRYPYYDAAKQPLARVPKVRRSDVLDGSVDEEGASNIEHLRNLQEISLLNQVPQNTDPWVVLNMRSVKDGKVLRNGDGKHWYKLWNKEMHRCVGFRGKLEGQESLLGPGKKAAKHGLPCYPASVIYGHMASQGLNIRRRTFGLDSGCVYGRKLSALVIGGPGAMIDDDSDDREDVDEGRNDGHGDDDDESEEELRTSKKPKNGDTVSFGDHYEGQIISVKCG